VNQSIINVTNHAFDRAKERLSLNANALTRLAEKAFTSGLKHSDMKGKLEKYITKLWFMHKSADNIRVYGENVFVFIGNTLITVYQLPNELRKYVKVCKDKLK
jgi:hypothetical protein